MIGEIVSEDHVWLLLLMQVTACVALGLVGSGLLKRHAARAHQALLAGLLAAILMPALYVAVKHLELGLLVSEMPAPPAADTDFSIVDGTAIVPLPATEIEYDPVAATQVSAGEAAPVRLPWRAILMASWGATTALLLGRLVLQFILGLRLLCGAEPVESADLHRALEEAKVRIGVRRGVRLRRSERIRSPVIWCWCPVPVLLVQQSAKATRGGCDWAGVFSHELAHLARRDHLSGLLAELLICALPWHPLMWWTRRRLTRLSEEACDDWVLAGGQAGVDYAESLLNLAPQRQLALVPTVVGKERAMKQRIRRIVKDRCSDPRVGRRWALGVSTAVICIVAGVAFAQPRPVPREPAAPPLLMEPDARPRRNQALAMEGRRNVLERMLNQLQDQARDTEAALRERGDDPGEEGQILRAELTTLHNQIQMLERQLQNLDQPRPARAPEAPPAARQQRLTDRLADLHAQAQDMRRRLEGIDDQDSEEAQELRVRLNQIRARIRAGEEQIAALERERAEVERQRVVREERPADAERERRTQDVRRRAETAATAARARAERSEEARARIEQLERQLEDLNRNDRGDSDEARELREALRAERRGTRATTRQTPAARQAQFAREMAQIEQELRQVEDPDGDRAAALQRELRQLRVARAADARQPQAIATTAAPRRAPADRALETEVEQLRGQVNGLNEQMRQMQKMLEKLIAQREPGTVGSAGQTQY